MTRFQKDTLDTEEQAALDAFEKTFSKRKIKSIPHVHKEIEHFKLIAKASGNKAKRVSCH